MRKILFIFIICFTVILSGCGTDINKKSDESIENESKKMHKGTIKYLGESKEFEVEDYKINYGNLSELFPEYDKASLHNINCKGTLGTIRKGENEYSKGNNSEKLEGDIIYIYSSGKDNITQYEIEDNFLCEITDYISAKDVDWKKHIKFKEETNLTEVSDIPILKIILEVDNVSDEDLEGKITKVFVNDKTIDSKYIYDSTYSVWKKSKGEVIYPANQYALKSAHQKHAKKIGMQVVLTDKDNFEIYKGTIWAKLEDTD